MKADPVFRTIQSKQVIVTFLALKKNNFFIFRLRKYSFSFICH